MDLAIPIRRLANQHENGTTVPRVQKGQSGQGLGDLGHGGTLSMIIRGVCIDMLITTTILHTLRVVTSQYVVRSSVRPSEGLDHGPTSCLSNPPLKIGSKEIANRKGSRPLILAGQTHDQTDGPSDVSKSTRFIDL